MSNEDRKFLITKFVCAKCGSNLSLTYDIPKSVGGLSSYERGEPTGAHMVNNFIAIEPCATCAKPLEKIVDALKALNEIAGGAA